MNMYEAVKEVKGHLIIRKIGSSYDKFHVMVKENEYVTFKTLKEAVEYIRNML